MMLYRQLKNNKKNDGEISEILQNDQKNNMIIHIEGEENLDLEDGELDENINQ